MFLQMQIAREGGQAGLTAAAFQPSSASGAQPPSSPGGHEYLKAAVDSLTSQMQRATNELRQLSVKVEALHEEQGRMKETVSGLQASSGANGGIEKKVIDRQTRFEGALMQVARQVDLLETRLREEHEASIRSIKEKISI